MQSKPAQQIRMQCPNTSLIHDNLCFHTVKMIHVRTNFIADFMRMYLHYKQRNDPTANSLWLSVRRKKWTQSTVIVGIEWYRTTKSNDDLSVKHDKDSLAILVEH